MNLVTVVRSVLALVFVVAACSGIPLMLAGESHINLSAADVNNAAKISEMVEQGLKPYFWGMGLVFFLVGLAIVLADGEEKLATLKPTEHDNC